MPPHTSDECPQPLCTQAYKEYRKLRGDEPKFVTTRDEIPDDVLREPKEFHEIWTKERNNMVEREKRGCHENDRWKGDSGEPWTRPDAAFMVFVERRRELIAYRYECLKQKSRDSPDSEATWVVYRLGRFRRRSKESGCFENKWSCELQSHVIEILLDL